MKAFTIESIEFDQLSSKNPNGCVWRSAFGQIFDLFIKSACLNIIMTIEFYHWISIVRMIYSLNQKKEIPSIISTYNLSDDLLHGQNSSWIRNIWLWRNTSLASIQPTSAPSNSEIVNFIVQRASAMEKLSSARTVLTTGQVIHPHPLASRMYYYNTWWNTDLTQF